MGLFNNKKVEIRADTLQMLVDKFSIDCISRKEIMEIPSIIACLNFITGIISSIPIKLYRENTEINSVSEVKDDVRVKLLNYETGDTFTATDLKKAFLTDYLLDGNGYIYINKNRNIVDSLHYVDQRYINIQSNQEPIFRKYNILVNGTKYRDFEFLKLLQNTSNGENGKGIIQNNQVILQAAYNLMSYTNVLARTGGNKKGILQFENRSDPDTLKSIGEKFRALYNNASRDNVITVNTGIKFEELSQSSVEMQLNEITESINQSICTIFGLSTEVISNKSTSDQYLNAIKTTIIPIIRAFETALNRDLLLDKEKDLLYFAFDLKELLKGDIEKRFNAYSTAIQANIMSIDEARYVEDLPALGLDFIKLGLQDVLYYPKDNKIYTPNTKEFMSLTGVDLVEGGEKTDEN